MGFLVDSLKKHRKAAYADLKAKADEKKLKVFPIMFGRAQAMLGIVKSAKRGAGKFAKATAAKATARPAARGPGRRPDATSKSGQIRELLKTGMSPAEIAKKVGATTGLVYNVKSSMGMASKRGPAKRGPGRPRKVVSGAASFDGLAGILDAVKDTERERAHLRAALLRIQSVIADALS